MQPRDPPSARLSVLARVDIEYALSDGRPVGAYDGDQPRRDACPYGERAAPVPHARHGDRGRARASRSGAHGHASPTAAACRWAPRPWRNRARLPGEPGRSATTKLDNAFTDLERDDDGPRTRRASRSGREASSRSGSTRATRTCMLFTGDPLPDVARRSLAVEPMTCPPNAFRTGESLIRARAGTVDHLSRGGSSRDDADAGQAARPDPRRRLRRRRRRAEARRTPTPTSCSSTGTTTTPSSRCSTSSRAACSRPRRSATRSATSWAPGEHDRPQGDGDRGRPRRAGGRFDGIPPITYDYLVFGLGAEVNFFGTEGAAEHAFPMYTLPHAVRLKDHLLERWEAADRDPSLVEDGALNVVVVGGGPTGSRDRRRARRALPGGLRRRLPETSRRIRRG